MSNPHPDPEARLRQWLEKFRLLLAKVVRGFANSRKDEQELFQNVLVQLWQSAGCFVGRCADSTRMCRVAFNRPWPGAGRQSAGIARQAGVADFEATPAPLAPDTAQIDALYAAIPANSPRPRPR